MRRRQIWAAQDAVRKEVAAIQEAHPPQRIPVDLSPGTCPNCGRSIGKGIVMHRKHCKGADPT